MCSALGGLLSQSALPLLGCLPMPHCQCSSRSSERKLMYSQSLNNLLFNCFSRYCCFLLMKQVFLLSACLLGGIHSVVHKLQSACHVSYMMLGSSGTETNQACMLYALRIFSLLNSYPSGRTRHRPSSPSPLP